MIKAGLKKCIVSKEEIDNNGGGGGIEIKIPGFKGNPQCPHEGQIFIEYYEGKIAVHVWNGDADPETIKIEKVRHQCTKCEADLGSLKSVHRTYTDGAISVGHYDNEDFFEPEISCHTEGDLRDGSDTCANCDTVVG